MATNNQFGGYSSPYGVTTAQDYGSMGNWSMPGASMYTDAANSFQMPQASFADYAAPAQPGMFGGMFDGMNDKFKDSGFLGSMDTKTGLKTEGWGGMALGAASGLMSGYMGMKNYGLAKQSLAQGKDQFERNFAAQKQTTNNRVADQWEARNGYAAGSVGTKDDYMKNRSIA